MGGEIEQVMGQNPNKMPRREFIQKSLTASGGLFIGMSLGDRLAVPELQGRMPKKSASDRRPRGNNGVGNGQDPQPPGNPPINDGPGTGPGNPGNRRKGSSKKGGKNRRRH